MPQYDSSQHVFIEAVGWRPEEEAERVNDFLLLSRGTTSSYLVTTDDGDVVINTGFAFQGPRHRERFETLLGRPLNVKAIFITQCHADLAGGWGAFADEGVTTVVQRNFWFNQGDRKTLGPFFEPRRKRVLHGIVPDAAHARVVTYPAALSPETAVSFGDSYKMEVGGRRFELYSAPAGETTDCMFVWMPDERVVFTGNHAGALYGALPHLYTLRGDRDRSVPQFLRDIRLLIDLKPQILATGHDFPTIGEDQVRIDMTKLYDAVAYIHDRTVEGMIAQESMWTLMREIKLPPHLEMKPGRGPVSWYVRAVWEEYTGWFRHEGTSELYATPAYAIWPKLAEMAGGPDALAAEAQKHLAAKDPEQAMHFIEIALAAAPGNKAAREAELEALEQFYDLTEGKTFDEMGWLETKIKEAKAALGRAA